MDFKSNLKNLVPMSDEEIEESSTMDLKLVTTNLTENIKINPTEGSVYGDFSKNSFVVFDSSDNAEDVNKEEVSYVYMNTIIDLIKGLNNKIDSLSTETSREKFVLSRVASLLNAGDDRAAKKEISRYEDICNYNDILFNLLEKTLPDFFINLREELVNTKECNLRIKNAYQDLESKLYKKLEEADRLRNIISQQSQDHRAQIDELSKENNNLKNEIVNIIETYGDKSNIKSYLEVDILEEIKNIIDDKTQRINDLTHENTEKNKTLAGFYAKEKDFDIVHLTGQLESYKESQKKLQEENLNLSQIVNKLSEKNTRLKQDLIFFNSEMKKALDTVSKKNETISRQKNLIELFQQKISGTSYPIDELRRKKYEIEQRLQKESDYFTKQSLKIEKEDCDRRLSDFLSINKKK